MKRPPIRILDLSGSPEQMGFTHGATYRDEIRAYTDERVALAASDLWTGQAIGRDGVLALADSMVAAHQAHSPALATEMLAMADAAGITPAEAVIVGGFTDFVDTVRAHKGGPHPDEVMEDDCTAFIVPDDMAADGTGFYGQTWDMHDTATEYVVLLRLAPDDAPNAVVFTTTGALGQIGMNELGVCVGINNLTATDGKPGVTWPQVVRHALTTESAAEAKDVIMDADLAGGHSFLVLDANGEGFSIEAMPSARPFDQLNGQALVHTNHTVHPEAQAVQGDRSPMLMDSSMRRLDIATKILGDSDGNLTADDMMELTREPTAVCQVAVEPYHVESSGAAIMRPRTLDFWACWGLPSHNEFTSVAIPPSN